MSFKVLSAQNLSRELECMKLKSQVSRWACFLSKQENLVTHNLQHQLQSFWDKCGLVQMSYWITNVLSYINLYFKSPSPWLSEGERRYLNVEGDKGSELKDHVSMLIVVPESHTVWQTRKAKGYVPANAKALDACQHKTIMSVQECECGIVSH